MGKISASEASRAVSWRERERAAEPGDMPLMPPFHDTRFWYHALIGQISSCWQIRGTVDSIALFQYRAPTIRGKFGFPATNKNFFARLIAYSLATRREKNVPVICFKQKRRIQNMENFLILSRDKLRSYLQSDWVINRRSKGTVL